MEKHPVRGIIFDMDNTLLRSSIDFGWMKRDIYVYLRERGLLSDNVSIDSETSSTLIQLALETGDMTQLQEEEVWAIAGKHELAGMEGAELEPGVPAMLEELRGKYLLVVLTNNSLSAARAALDDNRISHCFDLIVGRENAGKLKPSPDGFQYIMNSYPQLDRRSWLSVGDAWIDCKASQDACVRFIAYRADLTKLRSAGLTPDGCIAHIGELLNFIPRI